MFDGKKEIDDKEQRGDEEGDDVLQMPRAFEHAQKDQNSQDRHAERDQKQPPFNDVHQPQGDESDEKGGEYSEYGQGDHTLDAVADFFHPVFSGAFPFIVRGEKEIDADREDLRQTGEHVGVRNGLAAFPFGYRLVGIVQHGAEFGLRQPLCGAKPDDIAGCDQFQLVRVHKVNSFARGKSILNTVSIVTADSFQVKAERPAFPLPPALSSDRQR